MPTQFRNLIKEIWKSGPTLNPHNFGSTGPIQLSHTKFCSSEHELFILVFRFQFGLPKKK